MAGRASRPGLIGVWDSLDSRPFPLLLGSQASEGPAESYKDQHRTMMDTLFLEVIPGILA